MGDEDVQDEIKWPEALPDLQVLENHLKCGICYEFMTTALVTPCSHNFCSICIRKFMQYRTSCPECLTNVNEIELKNNRALDEMVVVMNRLRGPLSRALQGVPVAAPVPTPTPKEPPATPTKPLVKIQTLLSPQKPCSSKSVPSPLKSPQRRLTEEKWYPASPPSPSWVSKHRLDDGLPVYCPVSPDYSSKRGRNSPEHSPFTSVKTPQPHIKVDPPRNSAGPPVVNPSPAKIQVKSIINMMRSPMVAVGSQVTQRNVVMVNCPICQVEIPEANINIHIDRCLERSNQEVVASIKPPEKKHLSRRRLPKLVYELMKDQDLRKKCNEIKLSTQGDKKTLIKRHKRYTLLYNSECDCINPRPVSEIIRQVEKEEREELKANSKVFKALQVDRKQTPVMIEGLQEKYRSEHKSHFSKLVADVRERQRAKKSASTSSKAVSPNQPSTSNSAIPTPHLCSPPRKHQDDNPDSPDTPNAEMDQLLSQNESQPASPVIRKNVVARIEISDDEDSLDAMFSQPIPFSIEKKKAKKKTEVVSSDSDEGDWFSESPKEKSARKNSQIDNMPLRRSSRKRKSSSVDL